MIAAMRVKNEAWVIRYTLSALSTFVDKIVIVDDGSTDETFEICKSYEKVVDIHLNGLRRENAIDEAADWNLLTKMAIKHGADWILYTDADEMLEPAIVSFLEKLDQIPNVDLVRFRKISPWKSIHRYRTDKQRFDAPAEKTLNPILIRAKKSISWHDDRGGFIKKLVKFLVRGERFKPSLGRGFPTGIIGEVMNRDDIVSLHFNHLSMRRLIEKQVFYALIEKRLRPYRSRDEILDWVKKGWSTDGAQFTKIKEQWLWTEFVDLIEHEEDDDLAP